MNVPQRFVCYKCKQSAIGFIRTEIAVNRDTQNQEVLSAPILPSGWTSVIHPDSGESVFFCGNCANKIQKEYEEKKKKREELEKARALYQIKKKRMRKIKFICFIIIMVIIAIWYCITHL